MRKQVILARIDLKLSPGKLAAQVAHASLEAALKSSKKELSEWLGEGGKKVVLGVNDEHELKEFMRKADAEGLKNALIRDAGHTELKPGTLTCLGIGPDKEEKIDKVTGKLKIL
ncbi:peptidyl-tRNA hydrolase [Candidatus Woesearchaeota archaeon]|nr:peptidyl-tRNA hydrolase [Candidatus Woesearchaeota archaeon]